MEISENTNIKIVYDTETREYIILEVQWATKNRISGKIVEGKYINKEADVFIDQNSLRVQNSGHISDSIEILKAI